MYYFVFHERKRNSRQDFYNFTPKFTAESVAIDATKNLMMRDFRRFTHPYEPSWESENEKPFWNS